MGSKTRILVYAGLALLSIYFTYDLPGSLNFALNFGAGTDETKISLLYSFYAIPNIVLPYFFSYLASCSKHGLLCLLSVFVLLGQLTFTLGIYLNQFSIMLIGRMLLGIGGESYSVAQNKIIMEEFKINELTGIMAFYNSCGKIGTILTFLLTPVIASYFGALAASGFALVLVFFGCFSSYNSYASYKKIGLVPSPTECPSIDAEDVVDENVAMVQWRSPGRGASGWVCWPFKLLVFICFIFGCVWSPFYNIAPMMFHKRYKMGINTSSYTVGIIEGISLGILFAVSPVVGKIGNKLNLVVLGCLILIIAHLDIVLCSVNPLRAILLLGIASPLISFYWSCLPRLVPENKLSSAFAILFCVTNLAFVISPLCVAFLSTKNTTYLLVEIYLIILSCMSLIALLILLFFNGKYDLKLNDVIG